MEFRNDIQGLRAFAVIFVFIFHLSASWLPGGFIGVDIFFVISGFLVSSIIKHKINKDSFSLVSFYESRLKRIVPAYYFCLIFISVIAGFLFVRSDLFTFQSNLIWTMIFNSNYRFSTLDNYFGASSNENPLLHTWTLAVEMQFYLFLPLILLLFRNTRNLLIFLSIVSCLILIYTNYNIHLGKSGVMYFSLLARMPEFFIGVIAALSNIRSSSFVKRNSKYLSIFGLVIILICSILYTEELPFPGLTAMVPCLGTVLILISSNNKVNSFLENRLLVQLGEVSYSVYLWHWPIMAFLRYYNNEYEFSAYEKIFIIISTIGASLLSYYLIEKSLRSRSKLRFYIPFGIICIMAGSMVLLMFNINNRVFDNNQRFMTPSFGLSSHGTTFKEVGQLGDTSDFQPEKILLIGDSHALVMKKYFDEIGKKHGLMIETVTNNTWPTIPGIGLDSIKDERVFQLYNSLAKKVTEHLDDTKLLIIQFSGDGNKWKDQINELIQKSNPEQKILILQDFPKLDKNPVRVNKSIVLNKNKEQHYNLTWPKLEKSIVLNIEKSKNTRFVPLAESKIFTKAPFYKDTLMYYDSGHLNEYGSTVYSRETEELIMNSIRWGIK